VWAFQRCLARKISQITKFSKPATSVSGFGLLVSGQEGIRWDFRIESVFVLVSELASDVSLWLASSLTLVATAICSIVVFD
jgi:hypothetical protein